MKEIELVPPDQIEARSFEIIRENLTRTDLTNDEMQVLLRVIHTTADFDYEKNLVFRAGAVEEMKRLLAQGTDIVTDTSMAAAGIHKKSLGRLGGKVQNFLQDPDVAREAKERGLTRSWVCMEKAAGLGKPVVFAIGNAPTALLSLEHLMDRGYHPAAVIGVPVGFVNAEQSKERLLGRDCPYIVARGRKGGSNVAAAIVNALLYQVTGR
jgi:precorrin-8X/cobalt-precorrin-8 methylmutase